MQAHIVPVGNLANQMLQLAFMDSLQQDLPDLQIVGVDLPLWQLRRELPASPTAERLRLFGQYVDRQWLRGLLQRGWLRDFEFAALGFRMAHYDLERVRHLFPRAPTVTQVVTQDELLINVRGAETLDNVHADYGPLPVHYLRRLVEMTGLRPVLMGQIGSDWYSEALRNTFPGCREIPSQGVREDFEIIRATPHIAMSLSSFSWLASWLSEAQTIHMPVVGIFNPQQRPDIDLLPLEDPRYRFYAFEVRRWEASELQVRALSADGDWPRLTSQQLAATLKDAAHRMKPAQRAYRLKLLAALAMQRAGFHTRVGVRKIPA
jgi:hypothetical protein